MRRRQEELTEEFRQVERGWCVGGEEFKRELLEQVNVRPGPSHFGEAVQEAEDLRAERLVSEALKQMGWREADLKAHRKCDARKLELARQLRARTPMSVGWIAQRLSMGSRGYVTWLLSQDRRYHQSHSADQALLAI